MGNPSPSGDGLGPLRDALGDIRRRLSDLERPTGTSINSLVRQVQTALASITATVQKAISEQSYTRDQIDSKVTSPGAISPTSVTASGAGSFAAGLRSTAVYNENLATGGQYRAAYVHVDGRLGYVASSRRFKEGVVPSAVRAAAAKLLRLVDYRYIAEVENLGDEATLETGLIAEEVEALGLGFLVDRDEDGNPYGVKYERLALALLPLVQEHEDRLAALEAALEQKGVVVTQ